MFKRLIIDDWAYIVPIISFAVTATVFLTVTIRALLMPKPSREELARIPLD